MIIRCNYAGWSTQLKAFCQSFKNMTLEPRANFDMENPQNKEQYEDIFDNTEQRMVHAGTHLEKKNWEMQETQNKDIFKPSFNGKYRPL